MLTARPPGAALHLQESVTQHAGGCLTAESSDTTALVVPVVDATAAVVWFVGAWQWAAIPLTALPDVDTNAELSNANASPACQRRRVANTVPRRKRRVITAYSSPQSQDRATAAEFHGRARPFAASPSLELRRPQPQCVADDGHRAQRHGRGRNHGT